jgi:hypothetical protein
MTRSGRALPALRFGAGQAMLRLLQAEVVPPGWVTNGAFLAR